MKIAACGNTVRNALKRARQVAGLRLSDSRVISIVQRRLPGSRVSIYDVSLADGTSVEVTIRYGVKSEAHVIGGDDG